MDDSEKIKQFPIITLCGSTKFQKEFIEVQKRLTLGGYIGESTGREIRYAENSGKNITYYSSDIRKGKV